MGFFDLDVFLLLLDLRVPPLRKIGMRKIWNPRPVDLTNKIYVTLFEGLQDPSYQIKG